MSGNFVRIVLAALVGLGLHGPAARDALAQGLEPSVIAVIDFERVLRESVAGTELQRQVDRQRELFQAEIEEQETTLRAEDQDLAQQRAVLSPEAFALKRREFEEKVTSVQRLVQARKQVLDRALDKGTEGIKQTVIAILSDLAKERGFNIVLPMRQVLLVASTYDLTDEVMAEVNRRLPSVTVDFNAEP